MSQEQPSEFRKRIVIECMMDSCYTRIETTNNRATLGVYCPECRKEAKKLNDRLSYSRNLPANRARKKVNKARRKRYADE